MTNFKGTQHSSNYWKLQATQSYVMFVMFSVLEYMLSVFVLFIYLFIYSLCKDCSLVQAKQ